MPNAIKATGFWFEKQSVPEESFLLTGDGNFIDIRFSLQYRVADAVAFAYDLAEPEALVRSLTLSALRALVGTSGIDAIYTTERGAAEQQVMQRVQQLLNHYGAGIELLSVRPALRASADRSARRVPRRRERPGGQARTINRAQTFAVEDVNQAQGDAAAMIEKALALQG